MLNKTIIEGHRSSLPARHVHMADTADRIRFRRKPLSLENSYSSLAGDHVSIAMYEYFGNKNIRSFKQEMYTGTLLYMASISADRTNERSVNSEILYALLSDSPALIDSIARIRTRAADDGLANPLRWAFVAHMYQLAILGDYQQLQEKVELLGKIGHSKDRQVSAKGKDFFSLLMQGDKQALELHITERSRIKNQDSLTQDFMCFYGTMEAKICWLKGIEVQIDSPMLPMALMPIAPLEHYDDVYDFLQADYIPPHVGWLERLRYRLRDRATAKSLIKQALESSKRGGL